MVNLKILYIITLPDLGGAQSHVLDLIKGFCGSADIHLATSAHGPLTLAASALDVPIHILPSLGRSINILGDIKAIQECVQLIREIKPNIVHLHSSKAGLIGRIAARIAHVPVIFTAHGWGFKPGIPLLRRLIVWLSESFATLLSNHIICVSHYDGILARNCLPGPKKMFTTIHNGLTVEAELARTDAEIITIIMIARFHEPKEQQLLLRAFANINFSQVRLIFVGGGSELRASEELARELGVSEDVAFLGDRSDVSALLAQSQIFVLLSRYEGLPISILEAMRAGLPIIASYVGGIPEEVEHGVTGFLVPRGDVVAVSAALQQLISDAGLRRSMGEAGRQKFLHEFTLEQMITQTQAVYDDVLGSTLDASSFRTSFD